MIPPFFLRQIVYDYEEDFVLGRLVGERVVRDRNLGCTCPKTRRGRLSARDA
jgi:hypothetical protein